MFDRPSVTNINSGDGNQLNAERDIVINEVPEPKGSAIQNLLMNILNIEKREDASLSNEDYQTYSIEKKIFYNEISIYDKYYDEFKDGYTVVETRLRDLEMNGFADVRQLIINYVCKKYRLLSCQNISPDALIFSLDTEISNELRSVYTGKLSIDEINHVDYVIFHVFAKCKIFDKPPINFE